jgi:hypothetical protein
MIGNDDTKKPHDDLSVSAWRLHALQTFEHALDEAMKRGGDVDVQFTYEARDVQSGFRNPITREPERVIVRTGATRVTITPRPIQSLQGEN